MPERQRATFEASELAVVLSYYDIGVIESITEFARGSRRSPKVGIVSERGKFLLKRRAPQRAHSDRVRFAHRVQGHLAAVRFPVAKLIPLQNGADTFVQLRGYVYELFEFVAGQPYRQTWEEAREAGATLAQFHQAMNDFLIPAKLPTPRGDFHDNPAIRGGLFGIGAGLSSHDSFTGDEAALASLVQFLLATYETAGRTANTLGFESLPERIVHSDWHPGNILFRKQRAVAVIDYDSVRRSRRIIDISNGALQFSIMAGGDVDQWPDHVDEERYFAFLAGYESLSPLTDEERNCVPYLMAEALIAECVPPIQETGSVGPWGGYRVLQMIRRKLDWLSANAEHLRRPVREVESKK